MKPIHESSDVSEDHAFVALMSIANKHKLTYTSLTDIMKLISGLLPVPNVFLHSNLNQLINKYVNISEVVIKHSCCVSCMDLLAPGAVTVYAFNLSYSCHVNNEYIMNVHVDMYTCTCTRLASTFV